MEGTFQVAVTIIRTVYRVCDLLAFCRFLNKTRGLLRKELELELRVVDYIKVVPCSLWGDSDRNPGWRWHGGPPPERSGQTPPSSPVVSGPWPQWSGWGQSSVGPASAESGSGNPPHPWRLGSQRGSPSGAPSAQK